MKIAISGAHRTGKTTLAERLALENDFAMVYTKVEDVFKARKETAKDNEGLKGELGFHTREKIQLDVAYHISKVIEESDPCSFYDRSFLDVYGYSDAMLGDIIGTIDLNRRSDFYHKFHLHLREITKLFPICDFYIVLQPGIEFKDSGKSCSLETQQAVSDSIVYAANSHLHPNQYMILPSYVTNLEERVTLCQQAISDCLSSRSTSATIK